MSEFPTASSITDPLLESLLDELRRLRSALRLHTPGDRLSSGEAMCRGCAATPWPCPTVRTAYPAAALIAPQSSSPSPGVLPALESVDSTAECRLIAPQSRKELR